MYTFVGCISLGRKKTNYSCCKYNKNGSTECKVYNETFTKNFKLPSCQLQHLYIRSSPVVTALCNWVSSCLWLCRRSSHCLMPIGLHCVLLHTTSAIPIAAGIWLWYMPCCVSTKLEVHNISQHHQSKTEPWP